MLPFHFAIFAALQGVTEALPISRSGHEALTRIWLATSVPANTELHLGAAVGFLAVSHRRLLDALGEGVRAVSRPTLFRGSPSAHDAVVLAIGTVVSLVTSALTLPRVEMWSGSATATGIGLCVTGLALASTVMVPRQIDPPRLRVAASRPRLGPPLTMGPPAAGPAWTTPIDKGAAPSLAGAVIVGAAHGLAIFPGGSPVAAALTLLLWMGVRPGRAADLALLLTVPALLVAGARSAGVRVDTETSTLALGLVLALVGAGMAGELLRSIAERRRVSLFALWTIPLGLAMIAYARALPLPT